MDDLKPLGFGFEPNLSWISKAQIHGFQMTCIARNLGNPPLRFVPKQEILKSKDLKSRYFKSIDLKSKSKSKSKYPNGTYNHFIGGFGPKSQQPCGLTNSMRCGVIPVYNIPLRLQCQWYVLWFILIFSLEIVRVLLLYIMFL